MLVMEVDSEVEGPDVFVARSEALEHICVADSVLGTDQLSAGWRIVSLSARAVVWMTPKKLEFIIVSVRRGCNPA